MQSCGYVGSFDVIILQVYTEIGNLVSVWRMARLSHETSTFLDLPSKHKMKKKDTFVEIKFQLKVLAKVAFQCHSMPVDQIKFLLPSRNVRGLNFMEKIQFMAEKVERSHESNDKDYAGAIS